MAELNPRWADTWIRTLVQAGVEHAVICPGSRSAPLALACARASGLRCWSVIDERSAGFFALGLGMATGRPALVVVTSGTAGAHLYPAVMEAALSHVPLIVLTAVTPTSPAASGMTNIESMFCAAALNVTEPPTLLLVGTVFV